MKILDAYQLLFTPISPIHIGTGESYEPTNYVIEDGILHEFDTGAVMAALGPSDRKVLLDLTKGKPDTNMVIAVQRYFHDRRESLMPFAINRIPVLPGVARLYDRSIGKVAQREADGGEVVNRLEIDRTSHNPVTRLPILFGSSVKGAIRTALLNRVNRGSAATEKKGLHDLQGRLFDYLNERSRPDLERDPLRLLHIADARWRDPKALPPVRVHLAVNRKKAPVADTKGVLRKAMADNLYQILECVAPWQYRAFSGQADFRVLDSLADDKAAQKKLPNARFRFSFRDIADACNDFYLPILEAEMRIQMERGYLDDSWRESVLHLRAGSAERMRRGEMFLLRVGRHSGAESVTLNGTRNIRIKQRNGPDKFAKEASTYWLAADTKDQTGNLLPFGWILVESLPLDTPADDYNELTMICDSVASSSRQLANRIRAMNAEFDRVRADITTRRQADEEEAERRIEEERETARIDEANRQRLAAMPPEEQRIEAFRVLLAKESAVGPLSPSGQVASERTNLLRAALDWQVPEYRRLAAEVIAESVRALPWSKKAKEQRTQELERLRS